MPQDPRPAVGQNEMIRASAGSGKTFQLTNRYIGLMAHGVEPERIIALTFTRKAAGEFFDAILAKLAKAATDEAFCQELATSPYIPTLRPDDFLQLLRKLVSRMHLLSLGTLDSFFSSILRNFPFEFGLGGGFEILDEHLAASEQLRVYRQVFQRASPGHPQREQEAFLEAFKLATFGSEESRLIRQLGDFIKANHEIYLAAPSAQKWGNRSTIWPRGWQWGTEQGKLGDLTRKLLDSLASDELTDKQMDRWIKFGEAATAHAPGTPWPPPFKYLFEKLLENYAELEAGSTTLTIERRKQELGPAQCEILAEITRRLVSAELDNRLSRTRGIYSVINEYEKTYGRLVRRRGKLTFADLLIILTSADESSPLLSQTPDDDSRLQIDFRLDGRFDHWLLDEFQDTNYLQWRAIENLIDETVQDSSGQRTLFQVGDVKQAIYGWRGGDVRLFDEIQRRYRGEDGENRIVERRLDVSYRSGPDIIGMVNRVFGDPGALGEVCPESTRARWEHEWSDHVSNRTGLEGYACLLNPEPGEGKKKADRDDVFATMLSILEEIRPDQRGIDCAILVQGNKAAAEIVDYVRANSEIPIYSETDLHIAEDNPLTLGLLALLQFADHPSDSFAWQHLQMTPLGEILRADGVDQAELCREILDDLNRHGTEFIINRWLARLRDHSTDLDAFSLRRADEFGRAAQAFDQGGSKNLGEFLSFAENYTLREPPAEGTVQVMTIHKSKGLGFDLVLLPELAGDSLAIARDGIGVQRADDRSVEWVYSLPAKEIARKDAVLNEYLEQQEADSCYESLCKFYVAMTRAKRAMYLITQAHGSSKSANFVKLLEATLKTADPIPGQHHDEIIYATGDPLWFKTEAIAGADAIRPAGEAASRALATVSDSARRPRHRRLTPSSGNQPSHLSSAQIFSLADTNTLTRGSLVHALLEQIEWLDEIAPIELESLWDQHVPDATAEMRREVLDSLESAAPILNRPSPGARCWREKRFETLIDEDWISGTIDRVILDGDSATIVDFKTTALTDGAAPPKKYHDQLESYRTVVHKMTGIDKRKIRCCLFFTGARQLIDL